MHHRMVRLFLIALIVLPSLSLLGQASDCTTPNPRNCSPNAAGAPIPFTGDSGPQRIRKSIFDLTADELARYQKAVTAYRDLPFSDPRSWCRQANVHCYNCSGGNSHVEVHYTHAFLPWHRAYLYYYEKILGELVGDPTFALPYWDWNAVDTPECQQNYAIPSSYTTGSLYDQYRRQRRPGVTMDPNVVGAAVVNDIILDNPLVDDFVGTADEDSIMWPTPHGPVHNWVGQAPPRYFDMGSLLTAARDPIFFAHHNNIDRIWSDWATYYGNPSYSSDFNAQVFTFFDEKKQWRSITAGDVANLANLNVVFQPPSKCGLPLQPAGGGGGTVELSSEAATTVTADILEAPPVTAPTGRFAGKRVVLHIDDVRAPQLDEAVIRVFLNKPDATAATPVTDPHFVAQFTHVRTGVDDTHEGHADADLTFRLNAEHLRLIGEAGGQVQVTFVAAPTTRSDDLSATVEEIPPLRVLTARPYIRVEEPPR